MVVGMTAMLFMSCTGVAKSTVKEYQCPMKCEGEVTHQEQGRCSVCKMDLKEVK
jgi:protein SCO1/2